LVFIGENELIQYCVTCFLPLTKPDTFFDSKGICAACNSYTNRGIIDWRAREKEFIKIVESFSQKSSNSWDCIIPVSGGKDSTAQVLKILELGFNPLCVTATTCDLTEIGRRNLTNIKNLGVDHLEFSPNPIVRKRLNRIGLEQVGDISWPEHAGIFTIPVQVAVRFRIPLIVWGENSQNEYGGPASAAEKSTLTRRWLEEFGGLLGLRVSDLAGGFDFTEYELIPYKYPSDEELKDVGVTGVFLGHYFQWEGHANYLLAQANGFESFGKVIEGSIVDYENVDNYQTGIHDYFKFLKFGFGRATDIASIMMRRGILNRNQALKLIMKHDGKFPTTYLGKNLEDILSPLGLTIRDFIQICDKFTNKQLFQIDSAGNLIKDSFGNLSKINYDN
jgi:N-acetyl sugar amidotransferase